MSVMAALDERSWESRDKQGISPHSCHLDHVCMSVCRAGTAFGDSCPVLEDLAECGGDKIMKNLPKQWFWSETCTSA
jgi:hypothetical protein